MAEVEGLVKERIEKGQANHKRWLPQWAECLAFFEGKQLLLSHTLRPRVGFTVAAPALAFGETTALRV